MIRSFFALLIISICVSGCDRASRAPEVPYAQVGTRASIIGGGRDFIADVTRVENKLVTVEFRFAPNPEADPLVTYNYYRGLFPVSGTDNGERFELEYPEEALESLFPLEKGKEVRFDGSLHFIDTGKIYSVSESIRVLKKTAIELEGGPETVYVIEIDTSLQKDGQRRTLRKQRIYFAPALSMILKAVHKEEGREFFWRVVALEKAQDPRANRPKRRAGTVAI